jgi:protein tyrosine kinase modulator
MLGHRQLGFEDYKSILLRRWWIVVTTMCAGTLVGYAISRYVPKVYTSETLLAIEPPSLSGAITGDLSAYLASRLSSLQQRVFGQDPLQQLARKLGLIQTNDGQQHIQAVMEGTRKAISLAWAESPVSTGVKDFPGFTISCAFRSAGLAQQACVNVASMFIEENQREQQQELHSATAFLDGQLEDAKRKLDDQEARMAAFKGKHVGELSQQADGTDANILNVVTGLDAQLEQLEQSRRDAEQGRDYTQTLLEQRLASLQAPVTPQNTRAEVLEQQLADIEKSLVTLRARYTEKYPEIAKLETRAEELKREIHDSLSSNSETAGAGPGLEPPDVQQLRKQLHTYDQEMQDRAQAGLMLEKQIKVYESRLALSPTAEQEYQQVTRDYQAAQDFYNDLLKKKHEAEMASELQHRQEDEEIVVINPATLPQKPSSPNTRLFAFAGLGVGGALGLALILLLEIRDKSLRTEGDVELFLRLPVAVLVPSLDARAVTRLGQSKRPNEKERSQGLTLSS